MRIVLVFALAPALFVACGHDASAPQDASLPGNDSGSNGPPDAALADTGPIHDGSIGVPRDGTVADATGEASGALVDGGPPPPDGASPGSASVLEHHNSPTRNGLYIDQAFTRTAAAGVHRDATFNPGITGDIRAQPLFVDGGSTGTDLLLVATEENWVYALDSTGAALWSKQLAAPVPKADLPCGNIDPMGITGTPIVDATSRTMYLDAMTTPDGGTTKKHLVYALSIDTGKVVAGWPVDVSAAVHGFTSNVQGQRGALALVGGRLLVPYGGHAGDCGNYNGWVVAIPVANPAGVQAWSTPASKGGIWAVGGVASDGTSAFVSTGNTNSPAKWGGGEAVIRLTGGATFSGNTTDYFAPPNWQQLDGRDGDVGSSNPVIFDLPGNAPPRLVFQIGKPTTAWLLDPANLGGVGSGLVAADNVTTGESNTAPVAYTTPTGTFVAFQGPCPGGGDITALEITPGKPPAVHAGWCATQNGEGALAVSSTDGVSNFVVWGLAGNRLRAFDGETGAAIFDGGSATDTTKNVSRFQSPMIAKGYVYVGANGQLSRFH